VRLIALLLLAPLAACAPLPPSGPNPDSTERVSATKLPTSSHAEYPPRAAAAPAPRQAPTGPERAVRGAYTSGPTASGARAGADAAGAEDFDHIAVADAVPTPEPPSPMGNPRKYKVFGVEYQVMATAKGYKERGLASWYGAKFHGARTSSGEKYDMYSMSAAHKTLPLPTYCRVTNLDNGKTVIVRVNDRGPFKHNRVMDLSYAAAVKLDIVRSGTGKVEVEAIDPVEWQRTNAEFERQLEPPAAPVVVAAADASIAPTIATLGDPTALPATPTMWLQLGAYGDRARAEQFRDQLAKAGAGEATLVDSTTASGKPLTKVRLGPYDGAEAVDVASKRLDERGFVDYQLVIE